MHAHAPPENGEGVLQQTPTPKLTGLPQSNSSFAIRQACRHGTVVVEVMPPTHLHYEKKICGLCGRFLGWVAKPANVERRRLNMARVERLLTCPGLSSWETGFVRSLSRQAKFSPRQEMVLGRIYRQFFGGPAT